MSVCTRNLLKPPCTERYARWCERTAANHRLLLDHCPYFGVQSNERFTRGYRQHERYGNAWRRIRDRHLAREPLCEMCWKRGRFVAVTLVHHIKPLGDGGTHDESNLMSLCISCHEKIHKRKKPS
ncbi:HNH endonuclease [Selenomonas sputigena]|uniref:HNH endonuclease n=1 Tax=Selenomonas sputigena TaxID=69823 RepID=UPI0039B6FF50